MKTEHGQILREALRRTRIIESGEPTPGRSFLWQPHIDFEKEHGPWWHAGKWFGGGERLPEARRQRYVRAVRDLIARGLLVGSSQYGGKLDHVRLTPEGRAEAERLEAEPERREAEQLAAEAGASV